MLYRACCLLFCVPFAFLVGCGGDDSCRTDNYPAAPEGAASLVHVSAGCPADEADGSASAPYPTISEAVAKASKRAAVLIAPGTYRENIEITRDVSLVGSSRPEDPEAAAAELVTSGGYAIVVSGGEDVLLRGLHIVRPQVGGIKVVRAAARIQGSRIEGAIPSSDAVGGLGLVADTGAIHLEHSVIVGSAESGVYLSNSRGIILQNQIRDNRNGGVRIQDVSPELAIDVEGNSLERNGLFGVGVFNSRAIILQNTILATGADDPVAADGIIVSGEEGRVTELAAKDNVLSGSSRTGVICDGSVRSIILQNNVIETSGFGTSGSGAGVWLQRGCGGPDDLISGNRVIRNRFAGISIHGGTRGIILQKNTISGTEKGTKFNSVLEETVGDGITLSGLASAHIRDNNIAANARFGVVLDAPDASGMTLEGNVISHAERVGIILQNSDFEPGMNEFVGTGDTFQAVPAGTYAVLDEDLATQ